ncbi:MAG TPA: hypothetical protein VJ438_01950 [Candidatus Nanoarchaeia archaeon]|nr:hypothetical protein [Candidatus Nanoarchaeia archaeon]
MKNKKWLLIVIVVFILLPSVISKEIEVSFPEKINVNEEFQLKLKLVDFSHDSYDIKIDILNGEKRISKILNALEWKSTFYYVLDAIDEKDEKDFTIKIIEEFNSADISIRVRDSGGYVDTFTGYKIDKKDEEEVNSEGDEKIEEENKEIINITGGAILEEEKSEQKLDVINLNPKDINTEKNDSRILKEDYAWYGLAALSVLIIFLLVIGRKRKNEFE